MPCEGAAAHKSTKPGLLVSGAGEGRGGGREREGERERGRGVKKSAKREPLLTPWLPPPGVYRSQFRAGNAPQTHYPLECNAKGRRAGEALDSPHPSEVQAAAVLHSRPLTNVLFKAQTKSVDVYGEFISII